MPSFVKRLAAWAHALKQDGLVLWFALRHPGTPWGVKLLAFVVVAYALSPIDLVPDFIPVLGYLDDALLLPGLIWLALRLLPAPVREESRAQAEAWLAQKRVKPQMWLGAAGVLVAWLAVLGLLAWWVWPAGR